jgi:hypothetical protein
MTVSSKAVASALVAGRSTIRRSTRTRSSVSGTSLVQVDDEKIEVGPETAIYLPEGTVHAVWTRPDESVTIFYGFDEQPGVEITSVWLE